MHYNIQGKLVYNNIIENWPTKKPKQFITKTGDRGNRGEKGIDGDVGPPGSIGPKGYKGNIGDRGPKGLKGRRGPKGKQGPIGDQGDKGEVGMKGLQGDKGDMGPKGGKGDRGDSGISGVKGGKGNKGNLGFSGYPLIDYATCKKTSWTNEDEAIVWYHKDKTFCLPGSSYTNEDINIGDHTKGSIYEGRKACENNEDCLAYTYNKSEGTYILKKRIERANDGFSKPGLGDNFICFKKPYKELSDKAKKTLGENVFSYSWLPPPDPNLDYTTWYKDDPDPYREVTCPGNSVVTKIETKCFCGNPYTYEPIINYYHKDWAEVDSNGNPKNQYDKLEDAIEACNKLDSCNGITPETNSKYTLRKSINQFPNKNFMISWKKIPNLYGFNSKIKDGYYGPIDNHYYSGWAEVDSNGRPKYEHDNLEDAIEECNNLDSCNAITTEISGKYTTRKGNDPIYNNNEKIKSWEKIQVTDKPPQIKEICSESWGKNIISNDERNNNKYILRDCHHRLTCCDFKISDDPTYASDGRILDTKVTNRLFKNELDKDTIYNKLWILLNPKLEDGTFLSPFDYPDIFPYGTNYSNQDSLDYLNKNKPINWDNNKNYNSLTIKEKCNSHNCTVINDDKCDCSDILYQKQLNTFNVKTNNTNVKEIPYTNNCKSKECNKIGQLCTDNKVCINLKNDDTECANPPCWHEIMEPIKPGQGCGKSNDICTEPELGRVCPAKNKICTMDKNEHCDKPPCWNKIPILKKCPGKKCPTENQQCKLQFNDYNLPGFHCRNEVNEDCLNPPCWYKINNETNTCTEKECEFVGQKCIDQNGKAIKLCRNLDKSGCKSKPCWFDIEEIDCGINDDRCNINQIGHICKTTNPLIPKKECTNAYSTIFCNHPPCLIKENTDDFLMKLKRIVENNIKNDDDINYSTTKKTFKFDDRDTVGTITFDKLHNFLDLNWNIFEANSIKENLQFLWDKYEFDNEINYEEFIKLIKNMKVVPYNIREGQGRIYPNSILTGKTYNESNEYLNEYEFKESFYNKGPSGNIGFKGLRGEKGIQGPRGKKGEKGDIGPIGPIGPPGKPGLPGEKGRKGLRGAIGQFGPKGIKGLRGEKGIKGIKGIKGNKGNKGNKGSIGESGYSVSSYNIKDDDDNNNNKYSEWRPVVRSSNLPNENRMRPDNVCKDGALSGIRTSLNPEVYQIRHLMKEEYGCKRRLVCENWKCEKKNRECKYRMIPDPAQPPYWQFNRNYEMACKNIPSADNLINIDSTPTEYIDPNFGDDLYKEESLSKYPFLV